MEFEGYIPEGVGLAHELRAVVKMLQQVELLRLTQVGRIGGITTDHRLRITDILRRLHGNQRVDPMNYVLRSDVPNAVGIEVGVRGSDRELQVPQSVMRTDSKRLGCPVTWLMTTQACIYYGSRKWGNPTVEWKRYPASSYLYGAVLQSLAPHHQDDLSAPGIEVLHNPFSSY